MREPLRNLADIRVGYSFRTKIENDPLGDIRVLQISDVRSGAEIQPASLPLVQWSASGAPPLLKLGDVVMPSRGDHYEAVRIESSEPMIATGQLYVIKPRHSDVTSEYLCWYLNQPESKNYILKNRAGSSIPSLSRPMLGDLPVPVPPLGTQRKILDLARLWQQEKSFSQQLLVNRQKMLDGIFSKLLES